MQFIGEVSHSVPVHIETLVAIPVVAQAGAGDAGPDIREIPLEAVDLDYMGTEGGRPSVQHKSIS